MWRTKDMLTTITRTTTKYDCTLACPVFHGDFLRIYVPAKPHHIVPVYSDFAHASFSSPNISPAIWMRTRIWRENYKWNGQCWISLIAKGILPERKILLTVLDWFILFTFPVLFQWSYFVVRRIIAIRRSEQEGRLGAYHILRDISSKM